MDLTDILNNAEDQDRGRWFALVDQLTGQDTDIRLRIAGPDSATQARARVLVVDELADAADETGRVSGAAREAIRLNNLARCVLGWEIRENGVPVPFNHGNVLRLLRAAAWVHAQVDSFAADRRAFMSTP